MSTLPEARSVIVNPSQEEYRELVDAMPASTLTTSDNYTVRTDVVSRSAGSTYLITDDPESTQVQTMDRAEYAENVARQEAHIAEQDMILVEGYIGPENSPLRRAARVYMEKGQANIPAMQSQLYFPKDDEWDGDNALTIIYTPTCPADGYPQDRLVTIDLEEEITRVFHIDYFGECKMGGLRMWMDWVYGEEMLALHSGAKVIPTDDGEKVALIVGLSGTGKTTTTFQQQNGSLPVQDDIVALDKDGGVHSTENGCFAKTIGLDPEFEPTIHAALTSHDSWLENVELDDEGNIDFFDGSHTENGRGTFGLADIPHKDPREVGKADFLFILNRNESIIPGVARMTSPEQAAAYFMLGETKGTSAGGAAEAGKFLRVPGTNPFFMRFDYMQGNRLLEMLEGFDGFEVYLLSTGRVGGEKDVEGSKKIMIPHSSALVKGIAEGTIEWKVDPDFGYEIAASVPGIDDEEILEPRKLYERQGRMDEYNELVAKVKAEREEFMAKHEGLKQSIIDAL